MFYLKNPALLIGVTHGELQMVKGLSRFKPGVNRRTHLLLSAALWTAIGVMLLAKGTYRYSQLTDQQPLLVVFAILAGSFKAYFILDKSALRGISRILTFKDGTCLGAVYSAKTWILILCMMAMGVILRNSSIPIIYLCFLYFTIGWGLLMSSRLAWRAWLSGE